MPLRTAHTHKHDSRVCRGPSRIDKLYIAATGRTLVKGVTIEESPCSSDHKGVLVELHSPKDVLRIKKRGKIYPPPNFAKAATTSLNIQSLEALNSRIEQVEVGETADIWEGFKRRTIA